MHNKILIAVMMPVLLFSCEKQTIMTYDATDNIYFDYRRDVVPAQNQAGYPVDSLAYTFAYSDATITEKFIAIPVTVLGIAKVEDRPYQLRVDAGASAQPGKDYELPAPVIRAGRLKDTLFVKLKRTAALKQGLLRFTLHLQPNEQFETGISKRLSFSDTISALTFKISVTDVLNEGPAWSSQYSSYFGTFSTKKMLLMHEIVGIPLDFWSLSTLPGEGRAAATYYAAAMSRYLKEAALAGNTIYEDDKVTPMKMGADYQ